jgi:hypothetical protein
MSDFRTYVQAEMEPIRRSGGKVVGYFFLTDFAGPTNEALGLIDFTNVPAYEQYRNTLANDPDHKKNASQLEQRGGVYATNRSIIQRLETDQRG